MTIVFNIDFTTKNVTVETANALTFGQESNGGGAVDSVNGETGVVVLTTTDINEGTNLYFTNARAIAALAATLASYVTTAALNTALSAYVTAVSLAATLANYVTNSSLATTLLGYATTSQLSDKQDKRIVVSSNTTAVIDGAYTLVASATFTDPSPVEGKGFSVLIRNGTATIGGTGYSTVGTTVWRVFHSGAWANYVLSTTDLLAQKTGYTARVTGSSDPSTVSNIASNITGLLAPLEANKKYRVFGIIRMSCNNTGGVNFGALIPTGAIVDITLFGFTTSTSLFRYNRISADNTLAGTFTNVNSTGGFAYVVGEIETAATAGDIQMIFASAVNTQASSIFRFNTWLNFTEI
jgi:hypothetical protein